MLNRNSLGRHLVNLGGVELLKVAQDLDVVVCDKLNHTKKSDQRVPVKQPGLGPGSGLTLMATPLRPNRPERPIL